MKITLQIIDPLVLFLMGQLTIATELGVKLDEKLSTTAFETLACSIVVEVSHCSSGYKPRYNHPLKATIIQLDQSEAEICRLNLWIYTNGERYLLENAGEIESDLQSVTHSITEHIVNWMKTE